MKNFYTLITLIINLTFFAQDGTLDTTFGNNGAINVPNMGRIANIAIQTDGKIVGILATSTNNFLQSKIVVFRLNQNGTLDNGFGINGKLTIDLGNSIFLYGRDLKINNLNKIIIICNAYVPLTDSNTPQMYQLNSNGTVDLSFGNNGFITDCGYEIEIQPDNKIVSFIGYQFSATSAITLYKVYRHNTNGTLDLSFNNTGFKILNVGNDVSPSDLLLIDSNIVTSGYGTSTNNFCLKTAVFQNNGFSASLLNQNICYPVFPKSLVKCDSNSFYEIVHQNSIPSPFIIIKRYLTTTNNYNFGTNNSVTIFTGSASDQNFAFRGLVQPDGKLIVVGHDGSNLGFNWVLTRILPSGILDNTFGNSGITVTSAIDSINNVFCVISPIDGKLFMVGATTLGLSNIAVTVRRYNTGINLSTTNFNQNTNLKISPNPTNSTLNITTKDKINTLNIIDILGRKTNITNFENNTIDVNNLQNGIYFIEVATANGGQTQKFIKN